MSSADHVRRRRDDLASMSAGSDTQRWELIRALEVAEGGGVRGAGSRHRGVRRLAAACAGGGGRDERCRGQIMADTLVERVTGLASADRVPIEVQLVMTDEAMLSADSESSSEPAHVQGYGPVPAAFARSWVRDTDAEVWLRRLYTRPSAGSVVSMDSRRRVFTGQLRRFVVERYAEQKKKKKKKKKKKPSPWPVLKYWRSRFFYLYFSCWP